MAAYKVPQDVEAEDKLIGPFSFKQFIYLMVVAIGLGLAWFMSQIFIGLIVVPLPIIIFFGALALPLRKDQPMEIYLAAMVKFFLKPKKRMWEPEGQFNHVTITAPKVEERQLTKSYGRDEAGQRLSYLSQVIDSQGWSTRGEHDGPATSLNDAVSQEAAEAEDVFDESGQASRGFGSLIEEQEQIRHQQAMQTFKQGLQSEPQAPPAAPSPPLTPATAQDYVHFPVKATDDNPVPVFNPYPTMHQHVVSPQSQPAQPSASPAAVAPAPSSLPPSLPTLPTPQSSPQPPAPALSGQQSNPQLPVTSSQTQPPQDTSTTPTSPDIMRLANNNDLSISAIAREAHRIEEKDNNDNEVVVSLR